jgi:hypothetical protein
MGGRLTVGTPNDHRITTTRGLQDTSNKTLINVYMEEHVAKLYSDLEVQLNDKNHPAQLLTSACFKVAFIRYYEQYVEKQTPQTTNIDLLNKIIAKTVGLQSEYVFKMAEKFNSEN